MKLKRILALVLAFCMVFTSMSLGAFADGEAATVMPDAVNGVITLTSDVELADMFKIDEGEEITLDLNGHTLSQTKEQTAGYQMILNDGTLTIKDSVGTGKISYTDSGNGGEYISDTIYNRGTLVIDGGTIENLSSATVASNGYPHAVDTYSGIRDTSVTVNGGTIYCAEYSAIRMFCVSATYKADLVINGGTIKGAVDMQNGTKDAALGSLTINGGTFEITKNANNIRFANWNGGATEYGISAEIKAGTFDGGITTAYVPAAANWDSKIITGGTFKSDTIDVSEYVADGFEIDTETGLVVATPPVATVNGVGYNTLAEALAAVGAGDVEIDLLDNATLDVSDAYIELGTEETDSITINGNGNRLDLTTTYWSRLNMANENATLILNDMTVDSSQESGTWNSYDVTFLCPVELNNVVFEKAVALENDATLNDVTITETHDYYALWVSALGQTVEIDGLTINSDGRGIKIDDQYTNDNCAKVTFNIKNADINSVNKAAIMVKTALGADITAENVDIDDVQADNQNLVWVDEDAAAYENLVNVQGGTSYLEGTVATVGGVGYTDIQEAIKAAAPAGTVEIIADVTVDEWVMIAESLTIGNDDLITLAIDGMTINGNEHTLTINSIESAGNGGYLFFDAAKLNVNNLTIKYAEGLAGAIALKSGTLDNVTFDGCVYGVIPQSGEVVIQDCTFKTAGTSIYFEEERDGLTVTGCTFENADTVNVILLRGDVNFTNNTVLSGRTVNVVSGSPVVTGNDFNDVRLKVYNVATATIEDNVINVLAFNDDSEVLSTFSENTLSEAAEAALLAIGKIDVIEIYDWEDLKKLDEIVESGNTLEGVTVKLMNDIDLYEMGAGGEPVTFNPIGANKAYFKGTFDGQGHTIKNMYQSGWALGYDWDNYGTIGLFAYLWNATVKNLTIENAESFVEGGNVAAIAGCGWGDCTFENITVKNSTFATYNNRAAGIVGYTGGEGTMTFKDITIDEDTVIAGLWGSFDSSLGGVVASIQSPTLFVFEDVTVACRLDAYNDCTASYDYYNYRMCGMLIGRSTKYLTDNAYEVDLSNVTCKNVKIIIGEWANYHYCEPTPGLNGGRGMRVEPGYAYDGLPADFDHSQCTTNHMVCIPMASIVGGGQLGYNGTSAEELVEQGFDSTEIEVTDFAYIARAVAELDGKYYTTLQSAIDAANGNGTITLLKDVTEENITVNAPAGATLSVVIDLDGHTLYGYIAPSNPTSLTVKNGNIVNKNYNYSAIEVNSGELTVENVNIDSERHAVRIDGAVDATINGGVYRVLVNNKVSAHTINVSGAATVTIKDGTFYGPKGTPYGSAMGGSALQSRDTAVVTVEGGYFAGGVNNTIVGNDVSNVLIKGGYFDQDPTAYVATGYTVASNATGTLYSVSAGRAITLEAPTEVKTGESFEVKVFVNTDDIKGVKWTLDYDSKYFTLDSLEYDNKYTNSDTKESPDIIAENGAFDKNVHVATYKFTSTGYATTGSTITLTDVEMQTAIESINEINVSAAGASVTIKVAPDYVVEVGLLEPQDYVAGTKLVLVYTDAEEVTFDFNGIQMFDVTGAGYTYDGAENFTMTANTKVYALVVEALKDNTLAAYEAKVTVDYEGTAPTVTYDKNYNYLAKMHDNDVNISGTVNWNDIISVYAVAEHNDYAFRNAMDVVLKADVNGDKKVDTQDASPIINQVYEK